MLIECFNLDCVFTIFCISTRLHQVMKSLQQNEQNQCRFVFKVQLHFMVWKFLIFDIQILEQCLEIRLNVLNLDCVSATSFQPNEKKKTRKSLQQNMKYKHNQMIVIQTVSIYVYFVIGNFLKFNVVKLDGVLSIFTI